MGNILLARVHGLTVPYIVLCPPGTGKTKTVCEAVLQLCRHQSCTVLVTAPSNAAADLLLEKLSTSLSKTDMLRFMAFNRNPKEVSSVNKSLTYSYDDGEGVFVQPPFEHLLREGFVYSRLWLQPVAWPPNFSISACPENAGCHFH